MNEERKQGKNNGKNKQTHERPKHTSKKGHKMNTRTVNGRMKGGKRKNKQ